MSANNIDHTEMTSIQKVELAEQQETKEKGEPVLERDLGLIKDIKVRLSASVGECEMTVQDLFTLKADSLIQLDRVTGDPVDVVLDNKVIARGELVTVDDNFGVRITQIVEEEM